MCKSYEDEELKQFPNVEIEDLKQYVKEHCGSDWFTLIKDIKTPIDGASWVGVSKVFLRISGTDPATGKRIVKVITFEEAMGC